MDANPNPTPQGELPDECLFFIDDSNIWIEAQKFAAQGNTHMPKLTDSDHDPRLRINIGRLVNALLRANNGSYRAQGFPSYLYGSRPPPNDSVWEAIKKFKFNPKIYDKAAHPTGRAGAGREKEVDTSMGADMSEVATELRVRAELQPGSQHGHKSLKDRTVFICITGDRDMMQPIVKVLDAGIRLELWAWKSGISKEYLRMQGGEGNHPLFSVRYLDWIFPEISFTNFYSTRYGNAVNPAKTAVLSDFVPAWYEPTEDGADRNTGGSPPTGMSRKTRDQLEKAVCDQLLLLGKVFYITRGVKQATYTLFAEFRNVTNMEAVLQRLRKYFQGKASVLSWPEYASKFNQPAVPTVTTSNLYAPLSVDDASVQETDVVDDDEEAEADTEADAPADAPDASADTGGEWHTVTRSDPDAAHRRVLRQGQACRAGVRCSRRGDCGNRHTPEERSLFQEFPHQNFKKWKTAPCRHSVTKCYHGWRCAYAHSPAEAWCLECQCYGHYTSGCVYRTK